MSAKLRLIAGNDRLRRSDCDIGASFGVIKLTAAISSMTAPIRVINKTLGFLVMSSVAVSAGQRTSQVF